MSGTRLTHSQWRALSHRGPPANVTPLPDDRGMYGALSHVRWADGDAAVLKVGTDRARGARELLFYRTVAPSPEHPRLLGALETPDQVILLLEDLCSWIPGDILEGVPPARAEQAVAALGRIQARHRGRSPTGWKIAAPSWRATTPATIEVFLDRYPNDWARAALPGLPAAIERHRPELSSLGHTLVHADAHLDNWLFDPNAPRAVLIDWETARLAPGVIDLVRFLVEGVHAETRREGQDTLIARWCHETEVAEADALRSVRAALWWTLDAMLPHHATVELASLQPRMRRVHEHCVHQVLDAAEDLLG